MINSKAHGTASVTFHKILFGALQHTTYIAISKSSAAPLTTPLWERKNPTRLGSLPGFYMDNLLCFFSRSQNTILES